MDMQVADPRAWIGEVDQDRYRRILGIEPEAPIPEVARLEPEPVEPPAASVGGDDAGGGESAGVIESTVQLFGDHIDTDAIIPGEFCHLVDLEKLGEHCFHYVAPGFKARVQGGAAVIVAGEGWGSGSSREQAVWALKGAGVLVVIARSYAFIHKRNLVNEAVPHLVVRDDDFHALAADGAPIRVDLATGGIELGGRTFRAEAPTRMIRKLQEAGGIVPAIHSHGNDVFEKLTA